MPKRIVIAFLLFNFLLVEAQSIRLTPYQSSTALYLDAERLYNFNLYERSRFELGLTWVVPNETSPNAKYFLGQWTFRGYGAYSLGDKDFKFGGSAQLRLSNKSQTRIGLRAYKDLDRAASRRLSAYRMLSPTLNTGYVSSRYVGVRGAELWLNASPAPRFSYTLTARQTWEDYRFNASGLLFPTLHPLQQAPVRMFTELTAQLRWNFGLTVHASAGHVDDTALSYYLRTLLQYSTPKAMNGFAIFAQLGFATNGTPYSRMFDVSGTSNALYFFKNTFLTVAPNTFTTNIFTHLCLSYTAPLPLWELSWSSPHPFLQLNVLWGHLFGQNDSGHLTWEGLPLQSPYLGLLEPSTGFNGLIHWGLLDMGFGVAYQLCPPSAPYFADDPAKNIAFTIVADFILDKYNQ